MNDNKHASTMFTIWRVARLLAIVMVVILIAGVVQADVPTRVGVRGFVPNPGTQEQELGNITFPAPYNVFEFLVTSAARHSGTVAVSFTHLLPHQTVLEILCRLLLPKNTLPTPFSTSSCYRAPYAIVLPTFSHLLRDLTALGPITESL